jgi:hypothetical protein
VNGHFFITTSFIYFIEVDVSQLLCHVHDFQAFDGSLSDISSKRTCKHPAASEPQMLAH